jgi:hypothetical protein
MWWQEVLKPETVQAIQKMGPQADKVVERWLLGWQRQTLAMEKAGTLVPALKEQASEEARILSDARVGGENSHLTDWEILQIYGPPSGGPPYP